MSPAFWSVLDGLISSGRVVIDRPRGSPHPRFPGHIYPLDYGYLDGTRSGDGQGLDVWLGSGDHTVLTAALVSADLRKRDAEVRLLLGCTPADTRQVLAFLNGHPSFQALLIGRPT